MAAPYAYAIKEPQYQPAMRLVTAITKSHQAAVTTSFAHDYLTGLIVRLYVPQWYGMVQMDQQWGAITVTGTTTFTIDIDSTDFDAFSAPGALWYANARALVVPVGEVNSSLIQAVRNVS